MTMPEKSKRLPVSVIIAREDVDHPWQDDRRRVLDVVFGRIDFKAGGIVARGKGFEHYFAGTFPIEIHRKEVSAYVANLSEIQPSVFVVACKTDAPRAALPVEVRLVTVSPFEAQDFLDADEEIVEAIAMPSAVQRWLQDFVRLNYREDEFVKRKRDRPKKYLGTGSRRPATSTT